MTTLTSIIIAAAVLAAIFIIVAIIVKKRGTETHEIVKTRYVYRNEPHEDSTTPTPNRLRDDDDTKG